jgi:hypothetical protein
MEEILKMWAEETRHMVPLMDEAHQLADVVHP